MNKNSTTDNQSWQRLDAVIVRAGATVSGFARQAGIARAESLYRIKRGQDTISDDIAGRISAAFPEISKSWLLDGSGRMLHQCGE